MALFFHSDEVDEFIPFTEAVAISGNALRDLETPAADVIERLKNLTGR